MPTLTRPPETEPATMSHHIVSSRPGVGVEVGVVAAPPEELLPSGGPDHPAATAPLAPAVRPVRRYPRADDRFQRRVRAIHAQLLPVQTRAALASSYGREAARRTAPPLPGVAVPLRAPRRGATRRRLAALQVAYAVRWLELADPVPTAPAVIDQRSRFEG